MIPVPLPLVVLALVNICQVTCKPSFVENDSIVFPTDNETDTNLSDKLKECLEDDFKIVFNNECRSLLTTVGACPEGQWLVLDYYSASLPQPKYIGKCAPKKCNDTKDYHFWVERQRCAHVNESVSLCPKGNVLRTDYFGNGYCKCGDRPVQARNVRNGECYPVFKAGPCPTPSVWVEVNDHAQCRVDKCQVSRQQFINKTIVPWGDGKCYAVSEQGPCKGGRVVLVNLWSKTPECGDSFATLNLVSPPCTGTDHTGNCRPAVNTPQNIFIKQVAGQIKPRHRKISDPK